MKMTQSHVLDACLVVCMKAIIVAERVALRPSAGQACVLGVRCNRS